MANVGQRGIGRVEQGERGSCLEDAAVGEPAVLDCGEPPGGIGFVKSATHIGTALSRIGNAKLIRVATITGRSPETGNGRRGVYALNRAASASSRGGAFPGDHPVDDIVRKETAASRRGRRRTRVPVTGKSYGRPQVTLVVIISK